MQFLTITFRSIILYFNLFFKYIYKISYSPKSCDGQTIVLRILALSKHIVIILSGMEISYYVDHPVYRYRDIEKLGRICKTEGSWTKT